MTGLRKILTVFLVGLTFFVTQAFGYGALQAQANDTVSSPQGVYYKGTPEGAGRINHNDNNVVDKTKQNLKETADNVREKVNKVGDAVKTPEATHYNATPDEDNFSKGNKLSQNSGSNPLKGAAENIREKLNLDQEPPRATKEFLRSTEKKVENTVEPVTGRREGYYQDSARVR
ncbi:MAG: hypothetical protein KME46_11735 [Brasilonema angustatum HA4187-MV1]|jgi:hypothetical protein|nr:hypothetical protein [Brasilonema angustatum HA4187-MV1]